MEKQKDKIRREGLYDRDKGGIHMIDVETMIKALRLAWIPSTGKKIIIGKLFQTII